MGRSHEHGAMRYEASEAPDPKAWLELDESERIDLAIDYHRRNHLPLGEAPSSTVSCT
jgi:hypothetical protein